MHTYKRELEVAKDIARQAGVIMLKYFDADQKVEIKEDNSPVTIADKIINSLVIEKLSISFPEDGIIGEEESNTLYGTGRKWFCDPIDGTKGFIWGSPTSMFSLALVVDGVPVLGVVYDPFLDRIYEAVVGQGSYCNGELLRVSQKGIQGGLVAITDDVSKIMKQPHYITNLSKRGLVFVIINGAVYKSCLVAKGRIEGYFGSGVSAHDTAAIHVIIEESGGKVTSPDGKRLDYTKPFKGVIVSNGVTHNDLLECVNSN